MVSGKKVGDEVVMVMAPLQIYAIVQNVRHLLILYIHKIFFRFVNAEIAPDKIQD